MNIFKHNIFLYTIYINNLNGRGLLQTSLQTQTGCASSQNQWVIVTLVKALYCRFSCRCYLEWISSRCPKSFKSWSGSWCSKQASPDSFNPYRMYRMEFKVCKDIRFLSLLFTTRTELPVSALRRGRGRAGTRCSLWRGNSDSAFTSKSRQKSPIAAEKGARFVACRCFEKKSPKGSEK